MKLLLRNTQKTLTVSDANFACAFNKALVHQVICAYLAGARQGTKAQKNRGEVHGSGKKPWRQKGTGRARSGSIKSPIWRSGGVTFAARPRDYSQKLNKKMYRGALRSILSELVRQNRLIILEEFFIESPKTKLLLQKLKSLSVNNVLIIVKILEQNMVLASSNLHTVDIKCVTNINPISLISFSKTIMTVDAVKKIEELLIS